MRTLRAKMETGPIGVFDTGIGGLTLVRALRERTKREDIVYLGDNSRMPYGDHPYQTRVSWLSECLHFLESKEGAKAIILACNTLSPLLETHRERLPDIPIIGMIRPTVESLLAREHDDLMILGTSTTIASGLHRSLLKISEYDGVVETIGCPGLCEGIESGRWEEALAEFGRRTKLIDKERLWRVLLSCTHFPIIKEGIEATLRAEGFRTVIDDPASRVAERFLESCPKPIIRKGIGGTRLLFSKEGTAKTLERRGLTEDILKGMDFVVEDGISIG